MTNSTVIDAVRPSAILAAGHDPEQLAIVTFLARYRNPRTRESYAHDLRVYMRFCREQRVGMLDVERGHLELFIAQLENRGLAEATIAGCFGTVYNFLEYAEIDDRISKNPARKVSRPKIDRDAQRRPYFEIGEIHSIITRARANMGHAALELTYVTRPDSKCWPARREDARRKFKAAQCDYTLLHLMSSSGMRVGSVCSLNVESLVIGCGKQTKKTMPVEILLALRDYIDGRAEGPLFVNSYGNRITRHNVASVIDRLAKQVGITRHVPPHGLRRTFATTAHQLGATQSELQDGLDHADGRTTALYIRKTDGGAGARLRVAGLLSA